jgi:hypothetical protein
MMMMVVVVLAAAYCNSAHAWDADKGPAVVVMMVMVLVVAVAASFDDHCVVVMMVIILGELNVPSPVGARHVVGLERLYCVGNRRQEVGIGRGAKYLGWVRRLSSGVRAADCGDSCRSAEQCSNILVHGILQ